MKTCLIKYLLIFVVLNTACRKDVVTEIGTTDVLTKFKININGIDDGQKIDQLASKDVNDVESKIVHQELTQLSDDMEALVSLEEIPLSTSNSKNKLDPSRINKQASISNKVLPESNFRIVFFGPYNNLVDIPSDQQIKDTPALLSNNYAGQITGKTSPDGSPTVPPSPINLYKGKHYKFIAYSHNDTAVIPPLNTTSMPMKIELPANREVLYSQGFTSIPNTADAEVALTFAFQRLSVAFEIVVDARAMFGDISGMGVTTFNGNVKTGQLNLFTAEAAAGADSQNPSQTYDKYETYNFAKYNNRVKAVSFYTLASGAFPNTISITFRDPKITGDRRALDGFSTDWGDDHHFTNRTLNLTATNLSSLGLTLSPRKKFRIYATILMSGIKITNPNNSQDTMVWARGNLYQRLRPVTKTVNGITTTTLVNDPFSEQYMIRVHAGSNAYSTTTGSGSSRAVAPESGEFHAYPNTLVDPCTLVFPQGYWRLPTTTEYNNLLSWMPTVTIDNQTYSPTGTRRNPYVVSQGGGNTTIVPEVMMAKFFTASNNITAGQDWPYDNTKRITFLYFGRTTAGTNILENYDTNGYYWASTPAGNTNANVYQLGNDTFSNTTMGRTRKANIKCIKNTSFSLKLWNNGTLGSDLHRPLDTNNM